MPTQTRFAIVPNTAITEYTRKNPGHYTRDVVYTEVLSH